MRSIRHKLLIIFVLVTLAGRAQQSETVKKYIDTYKDLAIEEMIRTGVPAAITLAQGIHESGAGMGKLVLESNNHFGIKCKSNWTGATVKHDDDARGECFRKYPKPEDSYRDHSDFLKNGQRYAFLFDLDPTDYQGWANGLKKAGYATNPKYPQVLIKTVEDYGLQEYTFIALGKTPDGSYNLAELTFTKDDSSANSSIKKTMRTGPHFDVIGRSDKPYDVVKNEGIKKELPVYPAGQFLINETKVVFVKKGTSYLAIAKQYDVDLSKIFEFNEIERAEETGSDQLVYLQRKRKTGANEYHIVKPGETLHDIAQQEAIRIEALRELNWLEDDQKPAPGERLSLKKKSGNTPKLAVKENYDIIKAPTKKSTNNTN